MRRHAKRGRYASVILSAAAASLCIALTGCSSQPKQSDTQAQPASQPQQAPPQQQTQPQRYDLKGKVVAIDKAGKAVTVDAEDIPGFMSAMTMGYPVKDGQLLENLSLGDQITAKVVAAGGGEYWLEDIVVAKKLTPPK